MDNGGCSYKCNNTEGGFYCLCEDGYTLSSDNRTCIGKLILEDNFTIN